MDQSWTRRRWWEFRQGHSVYLVFVLTFINENKYRNKNC